MLIHANGEIYEKDKTILVISEDPDLIERARSFARSIGWKVLSRNTYYSDLIALPINVAIVDRNLLDVPRSCQGGEVAPEVDEDEPEREVFRVDWGGKTGWEEFLRFQKDLPDEEGSTLIAVDDRKDLPPCRKMYRIPKENWPGIVEVLKLVKAEIAQGMNQPKDLQRPDGRRETLN